MGYYQSTVHVNGISEGEEGMWQKMYLKKQWSKTSKIDERHNS